MADLDRSRLLNEASPVLVAMLVTALSNQIANADSDWAGLARRVAIAAMFFAPSLAAHLAACRLQRWSALAAWILGFALYPALVVFTTVSWGPSIWQWLLVAILSLILILLHPTARAQRDWRDAAAPAPILRLPVTLDGTVAALLALWVLGATSLFASTPDAVRNQPLRVWVNWGRFAAEPLETLCYLAQFTAFGLIFYGWYWLCRYVLVRRILRHQGIIPFGLAVILLLAMGTPAAASVGLLMPLNIPEWTVIPSENHNPFDWDNYRFTLWLTAIAIPIILIVERLLAEQAAVGTQHEQVRAELHLLQQQINPHFLFNTLNTLYALCLNERGESAAAVVKLSDLLRYSVYRGQADRSSLDDEIAYLKNYLDLQMLRFGHRCSLHTEWPSGGTKITLPPLLLIMLVENAFKHGVEPVEGACEVRITLTLVGRRIRFECLNSLPDEASTPVPGLGLVNLRRRLQLLVGKNFDLSTGRSGGFWRAYLEMDLQPC